MSKRNYDLQVNAGAEVSAPVLNYRPPRPRSTQRGIGVIGCGGISETHLTVYKQVGYNVVGISSRSAERAAARRDGFFPEAKTYTDYRQLLDNKDVEIVDVTTSPGPRARIIEEALRAGKHVLSQKPFVLDLPTGERLADLAEGMGLKLAVNQNGRWAPHFSYLREAVTGGVAGAVASLTMSVNWDHNWISGTPFDKVRHVLLYDFGIHWFDFIASVMGSRKPRMVRAHVQRSRSQDANPPLLAQASILYDDAVVNVIFDADTRFGAEDRTMLRGTRATLRSSGPSLSDQTVTGFSPAGWFRPELEGTWFREGFEGAMAELMSAIDEDREPLHNGRGNLNSLQLCFAAVASAERGEPIDPATITALPDAAH